jgi:hypothetical protein
LPIQTLGVKLSADVGVARASKWHGRSARWWWWVHRGPARTMRRSPRRCARCYAPCWSAAAPRRSTWRCTCLPPPPPPHVRTPHVAGWHRAMLRAACSSRLGAARRAGTACLPAMRLAQWGVPPPRALETALVLAGSLLSSWRGGYGAAGSSVRCMYGLPL